MVGLRSRRGFLTLVSALTASGLTTFRGSAVSDESDEFSVVDLHVDLSYQVNYRRKSFASGSGQFTSAGVKGGSVQGVVLPLFVPREVSPKGPRLQDWLDSYKRIYSELLHTHPYQLPGCIERPKGRVRTWLAFENASALAEDPKSVRLWAARGVRVFGLVHTYDNALASSSASQGSARYGLTALGRELVLEIHRAHGLIDVSHASDRATAEVVELAKRHRVPVLATHSNCRKLADHPRNLTDDQLRAIAATGGVVGINFHSPFLARGRPAGLDDIVRHIRHAVSVAGIDHVAIGSDFEGDIRPPPEIPNAAGFSKLARALLSAGLTRPEVRKVFSENALRVLCRPLTAPEPD